MSQFQKTSNFSQYLSGVAVPLLVIILGLAAYFVLLPKYKSVRTARGDLDIKKAEADRKEQSRDSVNALIKDYLAKKDKLGPIDTALPDAPKIPELLANYDEVAKRSGLLITTLLIAPAQTLANAEAGSDVSRVKRADELTNLTENLGVVQVDLSVRGRYVNMLNFLENIEANLRLMDVQSLTFDQTEPLTGIQDFSLRLQTYYQKNALK